MYSKTNYYLNHTDENGIIHKILLDGKNIVTTQCPSCNREHSKNLFELIHLFKNDEECFTDVHIFCDVCSAKELEARKYAEQQG
ncbi:MAG: hypothetical protein FWH07_05125 [Oscillospiraceae bacterium]|nr:hypothetical protein [Oscillospiraceae bacterium]